MSTSAIRPKLHWFDFARQVAQQAEYTTSGRVAFYFMHVLWCWNCLLIIDALLSVSLPVTDVLWLNGKS